VTTAALKDEWVKEKGRSALQNACIFVVCTELKIAGISKPKSSKGDKRPYTPVVKKDKCPPLAPNKHFKSSTETDGTVDDADMQAAKRRITLGATEAAMPTSGTGTEVKP
jgi:hypothetical protein